MNLITIAFEVKKEDQPAFIAMVGGLGDFFEKQGFTVSLFCDANRKTRFLQTFLTDKDTDQFVRIIQNQPSIRGMFEKIKESGSRVVVSVMHQVV